MSDEIKEISDKIKKCLIAGYDVDIITQDELNILWNYITNLQQERNKMACLVNDIQEDLEDYKSRVYKIEKYIEEHITADSNDDGDMWYTLCNNTSLDDFIINIRNFLQGGEDE